MQRVKHHIVRAIKRHLMRSEKQKIIERFNKNVKGELPNITDANKKHDGKYGHWLEKKMGISPNADNKPDLFGYEMKNQTSSGNITYGDWSADEYIFQHGRPSKNHATNENYNISRDKFLQIFGKPNKKKSNRISWSGEPCPTYYKIRTNFGQIIDIDQNNNIIIAYNFSLDKRNDKATIVPLSMQKENLIIAKWKYESIKKKLEDKFNQKGWFTCKKGLNGRYESIHFGPPMNFDTWLTLFKNKVVFFDSGMYQGNSRLYSQWRSRSAYWDKLITDDY